MSIYRNAGKKTTNTNSPQWCGVDLPDYTTEAGCWDSIEDCYKQGAACYAAAPPTGSRNCDAWNDRCRVTEPDCKKAPFVGPKHKGVKVTSLDADMPARFPRSWSPNENDCTLLAYQKRWFDASKWF